MCESRRDRDRGIEIIIRDFAKEAREAERAAEEAASQTQLTVRPIALDPDNQDDRILTHCEDNEPRSGAIFPSADAA
jgi:hypothetical protein